MATYKQACNNARAKSLRPDNQDCTVYVNGKIVSNTNGKAAQVEWYVSDWYDSDSTRATYRNGERKDG